MTKAKSAERIVVETGAFAAAMSELARVVESKQTLPILEHVLIEPAEMPDGRACLRLTATNLDMQYSVPVPLVSGTLPPVTTLAKRLSAILSAFDEGSQCAIEMLDGRIRLKAGGSQVTLPTLPAEDFPRMAVKDEATRFRLDGAAVRAALDTVRFAIGKDEVKFYLCGVSLSVHGGMVCLAASDGERFAMKEFPAPDEALPLDGADDIILPARLVALMAGIGEDGHWSLAIKPRSQAVIETASGREVIAKLIDNKYVPYRRALMAVERPNRIKVGKAALDAAINRVRLMADTKARRVSVQIAPDGLVLVGRAQDGADIIEAVPCEWDGAPCERAFNVNFLREGVAAIDGPDLVIACDGGNEKVSNQMIGADDLATFFLSGQYAGGQ